MSEFYTLESKLVRVSLALGGVLLLASADQVVPNATVRQSGTIDTAPADRVGNRAVLDAMMRDESCTVLSVTDRGQAKVALDGHTLQERTMLEVQVEQHIGPSGIGSPLAVQGMVRATSVIGATARSRQSPPRRRFAPARVPAVKDSRAQPDSGGGHIPRTGQAVSIWVMPLATWRPGTEITVHMESDIAIQEPGARPTHTCGLVGSTNCANTLVAQRPDASGGVTWRVVPGHGTPGLHTVTPYGPS